MGDSEPGLFSRCEVATVQHMFTLPKQLEQATIYASARREALMLSKTGGGL